MSEIHFYEDKDGISPVYDYIEYLSLRTDKDSRINHKKINDYIEVLSQFGTVVGEPYLKHLEGEIWELRPLRCRIFFAEWTSDSFILLHYFQFKKSQKTPKRDINKAKQNLKEIRDRSDNFENVEGS